MEESNDPIGTVQRMFAAFGAGDLDALIETVHPDSRWTYYGANPRLSKGEFSGHEKVRRLFERILERLAMMEFNTDKFVLQDSRGTWLSFLVVKPEPCGPQNSRFATSGRRNMS